MPITVPQNNNVGFGAAVGSTSVSFASGIAAGSIIVVTGQFDSASSGVTLSDGHSDAVTDSGLGTFTWTNYGATGFAKAFMTPTTGAQTITATYSGTNPTFGDVFIWEVAGLTTPAFDKHLQTSALTSTGMTLASGTLVNANEALFGYGANQSAVNSVNSPFTQDAANISPTGSGGGHDVVSVTTSVTLSMTGASSDNWGIILFSVYSSVAQNPFQSRIVFM